MITPKITNLGYSNLWTDMSTILGYQPNLDQYIRKLFANGEQDALYVWKSASSELQIIVTEAT